MLKIFTNPLDVSESETREYQCLLTEWLAIREQYPTARLYKDAICAQNDVTPKTKEQAWALKDASGLYQVVCHAGDPGTIMIAAAILSVATAVYTYMNMPKPPKDLGGVNGSTNNSLAQRQNQHRVGGRVPDIYGKVKSIPDLIAPVYRYYRNNIQVEECLLCIGTGYFDIKQADIKEGETPVNTIEGASISVYEPNTSLLSQTPQIKIGEAFETVPLVTKQVSSIDGKQTLLSPNYERYNVTNVSVTSNAIQTDYSYVDFSKVFKSGEKIIISGLSFGSVYDATLSGTTDISPNGVLTISTKSNIALVDNYKTIRIMSLLVDDETNGKLDLAGDYPISSISKGGSNGAYFYQVVLDSSYISINNNFLLLTQSAVSVISATLTSSTYNMSLDGEYTISSANSASIILVNPASVNPNWARLSELTQQQKDDLKKRTVTLAGSSENFVGWYYAGSKDSTGMLLNFVAPNGIYENDRAKTVNLEIQYQMIENGQPSGSVLTVSQTMQGVANNRNPIGISVKQSLPRAGQFRFRVKRTNDNGNSANLIDDVTFESAYSTYDSTKMVYPLDTVIRLRRMAIGSGTNASELNMILARKINTANGFVATSNFSDIVTALATDPYIGRMQANEVDTAALRVVSNDVINYFGTEKTAEFNYTFDDTNASYQEMVAFVAEAVFCNARRENGQHYFAFERQTANSLLLFNHRNMKPESLTVSEAFGIKDNHDGVELKWRNPDDNYAEAVIKLPDSLRTNYKTIETRGVTNYAQAWFIANRTWNKLKYGRKAIEFGAYGEADLVTRMDRIAVVDSTVPILCAGEVEAQNNLVLTLDYPLPDTTLTGLTIHLQLKNGVVDVIDVASIIDEYTVQLARIPMQPLVVDGVTHTTFAITKPSNSGFDAYLVEEKSASSMFESSITATKYDDRYYKNDTDFKNGLIS
ncbi:hypothetical protein KZX29_00005 [Moraxella osloensis]|uniref:host specificity factor TipJ family phage tail protein n=1 Tax=Faucicola osloensis TaxID=34062 RepID=UPI002005F2B9|nr:host specificity factor TipJ family phage tail protein [Moraxella osloensis]MCK6157189.1 hypothetical protein [Moraxella osloensis]